MLRINTGLRKNVAYIWLIRKVQVSQLSLQEKNLGHQENDFQKAKAKKRKGSF